MSADEGLEALALVFSEGTYIVSYYIYMYVLQILTMYANHVPTSSQIFHRTLIFGILIPNMSADEGLEAFALVFS